MKKIDNEAKEEVANNIKTEYRAGSFLPKEYKSIPDTKPKWLNDNIANAEQQQSDLEELESKISEFRRKLGL